MFTILDSLFVHLPVLDGFLLAGMQNVLVEKKQNVCGRFPWHFQLKKSKVRGTQCQKPLENGTYLAYMFTYSYRIKRWPTRVGRRRPLFAPSAVQWARTTLGKTDDRIRVSRRRADMFACLINVKICDDRSQRAEKVSNCTELSCSDFGKRAFSYKASNIWNISTAYQWHCTLHPTFMGCLHNLANIQQTSSSIITYKSKRPAIHVYFEYICWKFAGRLLDRVNTLLNVISEPTYLVYSASLPI